MHHPVLYYDASKSTNGGKAMVTQWVGMADREALKQAIDDYRAALLKALKQGDWYHVAMWAGEMQKCADKLANPYKS